MTQAATPLPPSGQTPEHRQNKKTPNMQEPNTSVLLFCSYGVEIGYNNSSVRGQWGEKKNNLIVFIKAREKTTTPQLSAL